MVFYVTYGSETWSLKRDYELGVIMCSDSPKIWKNFEHPIFWQYSYRFAGIGQKWKWL